MRRSRCVVTVHQTPPVAVSHSLIVRLPEHDRSCKPSGRNTSEVALSTCPLSGSPIATPGIASHSQTVWSFAKHSAKTAPVGGQCNGCGRTVVAIEGPTNCHKRPESNSPVIPAGRACMPSGENTNSAVILRSGSPIATPVAVLQHRRVTSYDADTTYRHWTHQTHVAGEHMDKSWSVDHSASPQYNGLRKVPAEAI